MRDPPNLRWPELQSSHSEGECAVELRSTGGALTILCADAVKSTLRMAEDAERFMRAEAALLALGREVATANRGTYYQGGGDGFILLFDSPADAVRAACDAQKRLLGRDWPANVAPLSVRVGIHTDNLRYLPDIGEYVGYGMHCAQRLMAAAHGGQILLSEAAHALLRSSLPLPGNIRCKPCGEISLRDIPAPMSLFLVQCDDAELCDLLPKSTERARHNLPGEDRRFVGREREIEEILSLFRDSGRRMVSIVGLGGIGKTRLALKVAERSLDRYPDGVWNVVCNALPGAQELDAAIAGAVGIEIGGINLSRELPAALREKELLLVLDCCEQLGQAADAIGRLLMETKRLHVLVTSRRALGLRWESLFHLDPMSVGDVDATDSDGVALFVDSARYADHSFLLTPQNQAPIREICRILEGIPLAIVLAAARLSVRSLPQLLEQLRASRFRIAGDMRQIIAEQFRLLPSREQRLLWMLEVFEGGFYAPDAEFVCLGEETDILDGLELLRCYTLLETRRTDEDIRYTILDTVREYLTEACGGSEPELTAVRERHARRFAAVAREIDVDVTAGRWRDGTARLWLEIANLRAASRFSLNKQLTELVAEFADALGRLYIVVGLWADFDELARNADPILCQPGRESAYSRLLARKGAVAKLRGDFGTARICWQERRALCEGAWDHAGSADAMQDLAGLALAAGDLATATTLARRTVRAGRAAEDSRIVALARVLQAEIAIESGNAEQAQRSARDAETLLRASGDKDSFAFAFPLLGRVYRQVGEHERAEAVLRDGIRTGVEGNRLWDVARACSEAGALYEAQGRFDLAARALVGAARIHSDLGSRLRQESADAIDAFRQSQATGGADALIQEAEHLTWLQNVQLLTTPAE